MMRKLNLWLALPLAALTLSACTDELTPYPGPNALIAAPIDRGFVDRGTLKDGDAAIVYDPDGCQGWLIDDGIEGYSGRRFDPVSGLPICNNAYPPGTVLGNYQTDGRSNGRDWVKGRTNSGSSYTTVRRVQYQTVQPTYSQAVQPTSGAVQYYGQ